MQYLINGYPATTMVPQVITSNLSKKPGHRGSTEPKGSWSQRAVGSVKIFFSRWGCHTVRFTVIDLLLVD